MQNRAITLHFNEEHLNEVTSLTGAPYSVIHAMLGRLSLWGLDGYSKVSIHADRDADFVAVYSDEDNRTFSLGAVWHKHENKYGYHS